ncbi:hypothetical protein E2C00_00535 [Streptomyces sp. WAC05374]|nr:hypothetical protein EF905_00410 [Streptomyces sp. WAC05374]TDF50062.1 hypothetical protein E2B92_00510 [Streptomyces sp. WAC05374]TDF57788.1 hypothetical protein E2C02_08300 [Streptomyces sp. WAC05374]TDF60316.1 hypothetical protein E2C00_00535 [Streptomyces sp. WAC05374]
MAQDALWTLPADGPPAKVIRRQDGGCRRAGDRQCPAAIIFVATSGCIWRQLPPVLRPASPPHALPALRPGEPGPGVAAPGTRSTRCPGELDRSWRAIDSVGLRTAKGAGDRTESDRPRQVGVRTFTSPSTGTDCRCH